MSFSIKLQRLKSLLRNYVTLHWKGGHSLKRSFWINTVLVNLIVFNLLRAVGVMIPEDSTIAALVFFIILSCLSVILSIWQQVGFWRSAGFLSDAYVRRLSKGWGIFSMCLSCYTLYVSVLPQVSEAIDALNSDNKVEDYKIVLLPNGKAIEFYGGIKIGAASDLKRLLEASPYVTLVHITTGGGRIGEAIAIANIIKERKLSTYVPYLCASAGTIVFAAGRERIVREGAKIGFHSGSFGGQLLRMQSLEVFKNVGLKESFLRPLISSIELVYPENKTLMAEGLITQITTGEGFSRSSVELSKKPLATFQAEFERETPIFLNIKRLRPESYKTTMLAMYDRYQMGYSSSDIGKEMRPLIGSIVAERTPRAGNKTMEKWLSFNIKLIEENSEKEPHLVIARISQQSQIDPSRFPSYPLDEELAFVSMILEEDTVVMTPSQKSRAGETLKTIFNENFKQSDIQVLFGGVVPTERAEAMRACKLHLLLYTKIRALPSDLRGDLMRFIFDE
jgi:hypothetical protein